VNEYEQNERSEVPTALSLKTEGFWNIAPCYWVSISISFIMSSFSVLRSPKKRLFDPKDGDIKTMGAICQTMQYNILEHLNIQ
jgi:hypothetical protein